MHFDAVDIVGITSDHNGFIGKKRVDSVNPDLIKFATISAINEVELVD